MVVVAELDLVPIDVVLGHVLCIVLLRYTHSRTCCADTILSIPACVGTSLNSHVIGGQVSQEHTAGLKLQSRAELADELHVLLVSYYAAALALCQRHRVLSHTLKY